MLIFLAFAGFFACCIVAAAGFAPGIPWTAGEGQAPSLRDVLLGRVRRFDRELDRIPLIGAYIASNNKKRLQRQVLRRLPGFFGDLGIYLREGRRQLPGAIQAAIQNLDDPLSLTLQEYMPQVQLGRPVQEALRETAREIDFAYLSDSIEDLLAAEGTQGQIEVLATLQELALEEWAHEKQMAAATLNLQLMLMFWPFLFVALMLAILAPIALGALSVLP